MGTDYGSPFASILGGLNSSTAWAGTNTNTDAFLQQAHQPMIQGIQIANDSMSIVNNFLSPSKKTFFENLKDEVNNWLKQSEV